MPWYTTLALTALFVSVVRYVQRRRRNPRGLPRPPGPKGYPIIGNLFDMTWSSTWVLFGEWAKQYGDIVYVEVLGQPFLILNSLRTTRDILDKRSAIYSSRHPLPMLLDLMESDYNIGLIPYGPPWKIRRRTFHEYFYPNAVRNYKPAQIQHSRALLKQLLQTPDDFVYSLRHMFAALIMEVAYGIQIQDKGDPYVTRAMEVMDIGTEAATPGAYWVDLFPILKYVPAWMPGAGFQKKAAYCAELNRQLRKLPFQETEDQMKKGTAPPSIAKSLIEKLPPKDDPSYKEQRAIAEDVTGIAYIGAADTTLSTVLGFFLAMSLYPKVLKRAQEEIDRVVGRERLPDFDDQESLPYIKAVCMETLRWLNVTPSGIPHSSIADDVYEGYFIPKGTVIIGNVWAILHDPAVYEDPFEFMPERYINPNGTFNQDVRSPHVAAFGFGRRICPGRHMSDNSLYATIASVIAAFDIKAPLGADGKEYRNKPQTTTGAVVYPVPFKCRITPRDAQAEKLIREASAV